mgnify:CR=1 FL=1
MLQIPRERTFQIVGGIGDEAQKVINQIAEARDKYPDEWLNLMICSGGGNATPFFAAYDILRGLSRDKLQTVCIGACSSMALIVFLAGERRIISPNATIFIHEITFSKNFQCVTYEVLRGYLDVLRLDTEMYRQIVAERSRRKIEEVEGWMKKNQVFTAVESIRHNLAHEVLSV